MVTKSHTGPTTQDLLRARSHALSLTVYPEYPPNPTQRAKNKALLKIVTYLDKLIVERLTNRRVTNE